MHISNCTYIFKQLLAKSGQCDLMDQFKPTFRDIQPDLIFPSASFSSKTAFWREIVRMLMNRCSIFHPGKVNSMLIFWPEDINLDRGPLIEFIIIRKISFST